MNVQMKKLREQEQLLKHARQENAQYETLLQKKESVKQAMRELEELLRLKKEQLRNYENLYKSWPLIMEAEQIKSRLEQVGPVDFPAEGIARLEKYKDQLIHVSSALATAKQKWAETKEELEAHAPMPGFQQSRAELLVQGWPSYEQADEKISLIAKEIEDYEKETAYILKELNLSEHIFSAMHEFNLGMDMKAKLKEQVRQYVRLEGKISDMDDMLNNELVLLKKCEETCKDIEHNLIDEETFQKWKKQYDMHASVQSAEQEKRTLEREIERLLEQKSREERVRAQKRKQSFIINGLFVSLFAFVFIWSFFPTNGYLHCFPSLPSCIRL